MYMRRGIGLARRAPTLAAPDRGAVASARFATYSGAILSLFLFLFLSSKFLFLFCCCIAGRLERAPPPTAGGQVIPGAGKEVGAILNAPTLSTVAILAGRRLLACRRTDDQQASVFFRTVVCFLASSASKSPVSSGSQSGSLKQKSNTTPCTQTYTIRFSTTKSLLCVSEA